MNIDEIFKHLPHRYPFMLVDRVLEIKEGESIIALKNVTINEPFFVGHFPENPVMPGVLIIESMAQAATILAYVSTQSRPGEGGGIFYFAGIDHARFRRMVRPGDQLRLEVKFLRTIRNIWKLTGNAFVGDELACSADFLSARG